AADQLDVEMAHVEHAPAGFADDRECFGQQVVERLAVGEALLEFGSLAAQGVIAERLDRGLERVDLRDERTQLFQFAVVLSAEQRGEDLLDHLCGQSTSGYSN